ncbi:MAG: hypothetical protein ABIR98_07845 [Usitatibacter sp.]
MSPTAAGANPSASRGLTTAEGAIATQKGNAYGRGVGRLRAAFLIVQRNIVSAWSMGEAHGASQLLPKYFHYISQVTENNQITDRETARKNSAKPLSHKQNLLK